MKLGDETDRLLTMDIVGGHVTHSRLLKIK